MAEHDATGAPRSATAGLSDGAGADAATDPPVARRPEGARAALVTVARLGVALAGRDILAGVDLSVRPGEIVTVIGANGSGKSTLLRAILAILKPASGSVHRRPGLSIGYVPQRLALDPTMPMTVERFLDLPLRTSRASRTAALERVGAAGLARRSMQALSGGQFQRVLLARALLSRPDLLMLDEPTQGLDQPGAAAFYALIDEVRRTTGCAVLMVSHDIHVVMAASDRVVCLREGRVCCEGKPDDVASAPEYRALFGEGASGVLALYRHQEPADASCSATS
jgi:zinc transport system ATP-binding protein